MSNSCPGVLWITGLSGSGKTTLAQAIVPKLRERGLPVILLDGDSVRELVVPAAGYSRPERLAVAQYLGRLSRFLAGQGVTVVCSTISLFHEQQRWNRVQIRRYFEAYIRVPLPLLVSRDVKGLYREAQAGLRKDVVGIDIPAEEPQNPDWVWENVGAKADVETRAEQLIDLYLRSPAHDLPESG